jgi:probable rRNA maturation factor
MPDSSIQVDFFRDPPSTKFPWAAEFGKLCSGIIRAENCSGTVNVILCTDLQVRALNKEYRKMDKVTDVLSFEWNTEGILGEIFIAEDQIRRQAPRFDNSFKAELKRMLVHGILHLCGYDHLTPPDRKAMRAREAEILGTEK